MKELSEKYYLTHFLEFVQFIRTTSAHLLSHDELAFLSEFDSLPEQAQCMLVRIVNRKSAFIHTDTLIYNEIPDNSLAISTLIKADLITPISNTHYADFIAQLSKQELIEITAEITLNRPTKSANKQKWIEFAQAHLDNQIAFGNVQASNIVKSYIYFVQQPIFQYLLFLYFGHLNGRLNRFSLRDLGIVHTQSVQHQQSHFLTLEEAKSAFLHATQYKQIKESNKANIDALKTLATAQLCIAKPIGYVAKEKYHYGLYQLGKAILPFEQALTEPLGEQLLSQSQHPAAQEHYIRLLYKKAETEYCKQLLLKIIEEPQSDALLLFAEDFYALKFGNKKTSILTDMLRQSPPALLIDEAYLGHVESGVKNIYIKRGMQCYFTENKLWRALFALFFWQELYQHPNSRRANEFSFYPKVLKENAFYKNFAAQIEHKLAQLNSQALLLSQLEETYLAHKGTPNGLFYWHDRLLEVLSCFILNSPIDSVRSFLLSMAKHFDSLRDGFPDLMIIDNGQVYFEEIKAPGDSLRRNQLITIKHLIKAGFKVNLQRVEWQFDAEQSYVVVDIETTGGKKAHHRVIEVAMVRIENGEIVDTWQSLVKPERHIPKMITALTGINNDMVTNAPVFADVADEIDTFSQNAIFVAHNVNFDLGFLKQEFARLDKRFIRAKVCTVQQARKYLPGHASYSLNKLCDALAIPLDNHHRALDDAMAAAKILMKINYQRSKNLDV